MLAISWVESGTGTPTGTSSTCAPTDQPLSGDAWADADNPAAWFRSIQLAGLTDVPEATSGTAWVDLDQDGDPDAIVARDSALTFLRNDGCFRFTDVPLGQGNLDSTDLGGPMVADFGLARTLGSAPLALLRRVHTPILSPALLSALLLVFVDVLKELPATLILRPFNFETLATRAYRLASDERIAEASTASLTILAVGLVPVLLLAWQNFGARRTQTQPE